MADVEIDPEQLQEVLEYIMETEDNPETAFGLLVCAAVAIARDVGGLDEEKFLHNVKAAWGSVPVGVLSKEGAEVKKFDA